MPASEDTQFARLVSLACHDLRTPLATVHGFARTIQRAGQVEDPTSRYVQMIVDASEQLTEILDVLGLAARIEARRYEPNLQPVETAELVASAAARVEGAVVLDGDSAPVSVDGDAAARALADLATCARRHGGLDSVELEAARETVAIRPVTPAAAPILVAEDLRDLGAAIAGRTIRALGGDLRVAGEELRVLLPRVP